MKIPIGIKVGGLVVLTTLFYTYVGQLVPQKEVPAPEVVEIAKDMSTDQLVEVGEKIASGKGLCLTCHTVGKSGALRYPDLDGIFTRAETRVEGLTALEYIAQSMYDPEVYIVPGFQGGMPVINKAPVSLSDQEIRAVIAWLQSLGGSPTMTMETPISYMGGGAGDAGEGG